MKIFNLDYFFFLFKIKPACYIFLYHRVADVKDDPHLLSVSVCNFRNQVAWLKKNFKVISLLELVNQIKTNSLNSESICLTIDDGYADSFYNALPILKQFKVPTTIFITSGMIDKKTPFYWDTNTNRNNQGRALNEMELIKLSKEPLIEIGSHTITHPHLTALSIIDQKKEIAESKMNLENIIKKRIIGFSYPFGTGKDYNKQTINLVKTSGYTYANANFPGRVNKFSNPYELPRIIIRNWPIEVFIKKMRKIL